MPNSLTQLTDAYEPEVDTGLPVANPYRRIPVYKSEDIVPENKVEGPSVFSQNVDKILNALFRDDEKRLQLWPEKVVREGLSAAHDAMTGELPQWAIDPNTGDVHTSPQMVEKAQSMAALAGTGGIGGVTDATLGATPFLRPALKYKDRLYKGKEGQQHMDVIPEALYPEFQKMAMSGEDISHYNFGFVNDKGHFLDREKALRYAIDTGMVDKFAGQYGALTSTLLADSTKPGMAIEAMGKSNAPTFYSAVEHNLNKIPQTKMTGDQWLGTLVNKPGVKPEELDWTGLRQYLQDNKGKVVTKEQIEQHLASNKIELKEVNKGGITERDNVTPDQIAQDKYKAEWDAKVKEIQELRPKLDDFERKLTNDEYIAVQNKYKDLNFELDDIHDKMIGETIHRMGGLGKPTKYHSYQLPGGENYREMLLTLPKENKTKWTKNADGSVSADGYTIKNEPQNGQDFFVTYGNNGRRLSGNDSLENAQNLIEMAGKNAAKTDWYRSSHWGEPNILVHVRMNDRDVGGKKSLHLEEIQSDWHQQGREHGYKDKNIMDAIYRLRNNKQTDADLDLLMKNNINTKEYDMNKLPDAPFKKNWHELALKRMIREASEKGYDRLSWTPGEAQAARYDLSKQVSTVVYKDGNLTAIGPTGQHVINNQAVPKEKLADYLGKEAAEKLLKQEPHNGAQALQGEQLKIGGEGMKGFYDQIIPKALEKLGKEHGVKVKQEGIGRKYYEVVDDKGKVHFTFPNEQVASELAKANNMKTKVVNENTVHYIDIPQSLRDTALHKGFPLFSGKYMFAPVDYEPEFK